MFASTWAGNTFTEIGEYIISFDGGQITVYNHDVSPDKEVYFCTCIAGYSIPEARQQQMKEGK